MLISYKAEVSVAELYREVWQRANTKAAFQIRYLNAVDKIISESEDSMIILTTKLT